MPRCTGTNATKSSSITVTSKGNSTTWRKIPANFENLWDDTESENLRFVLMRRNFDALAFSIDPGPPQTRPH